MTLSERLAEYVSEITSRNIPREVTNRCKLHLLDFLGIPVAASSEESSKSVFNAVISLGVRGDCTVIPHGKLFPPQYASLINATYGHSLEFDDAHRSASLHPGTVVIPTILALGEMKDIDGEVAIRAMVAGYDVMCKIGMAINPPEHYARGFHGTATCGVFGATAAGAVIEGLGEDEILNAFGVNISMASGSLQFLENGAWNKRLHPGLAAHNAIASLQLAKNGFIGASKPIEGRFGLLSSYTHNPQPEQVISGLGERYEIMFTGIKPYPCCRYTHPAVDLALQFRQEGIEIEDIKRVEVEMIRAGYILVGHPLEKKQEPKNVVEAQFSLPFTVAVALSRGRLTLEDFDIKTLENPEIKKLMQKIYVVHNPEFDKKFPQKWPYLMRIKTKNGRTLEARRDYPRGEPEEPLTFSEVAEKFRSLTHGKLNEEQIDGLLEAVKNLEKASIREIVQYLTIQTY